METSFYMLPLLNIAIYSQHRIDVPPLKGVEEVCFQLNIAKYSYGRSKIDVSLVEVVLILAGVALLVFIVRR